MTAADDATVTADRCLTCGAVTATATAPVYCGPCIASAARRVRARLEAWRAADPARRQLAYRNARR